MPILNKLEITTTTVVPTLPVKPNEIFIVKHPNSTYIETYVANGTGTALQRHINESDIDSKITARLSAAIDNSNKYAYTNTIAERNALDTAIYKRALVVDASGDPTVNSGGAEYRYDDVSHTWVKYSETESMDIVQSWNSLQGKPNSTPAQIDSAVGKAHEHNNLSQLNKISDDGKGNMTYDNKLIATTINSAW